MIIVSEAIEGITKTSKQACVFSACRDEALSTMDTAFRIGFYFTKARWTCFTHGSIIRLETLCTLSFYTSVIIFVQFDLGGLTCQRFIQKKNIM